MLLFPATPLPLHMHTTPPTSAHRGRLRVERTLPDPESHGRRSVNRKEKQPPPSASAAASLGRWFLFQQLTLQKKRQLKSDILAHSIHLCQKPQKHSQGFLSKAVLLREGGRANSGSNLASNKGSIKARIPSVSVQRALQNPKTSYFLFL